MKKLLFLLIIIALNYHCKKEDFEIKGDPVDLIAEDNAFIFTKTVILFDDNNYLIKTPLDTFVLGHPFNLNDGYYNDLKTKAINDAIQNNTLKVYDYMPYKGDTIYTLAYHLEKGSCFMWDKNAQKSIKTIYIENYSEGQAMQSWGGRRFYIRDKLFFQTVDFISK